MATRGPHRYIAVAGNIGVGKSTMVEFLCTRYGFRPFMEPNAENPFLDDFYRDMTRWAFHSQVNFLGNKFRLHRELMQQEGATVVQDRTIYEDAEVFARNLHAQGHLTDREWETYLDLYKAMRGALQPPDLMIYLKCSVRSMRRRIKGRGRESEQDIPLAYLKSLNNMYEDWFARYDLGPVLVWETDRTNYLTDLVHRLEFTRALKPFLL